MSDKPDVCSRIQPQLSEYLQGTLDKEASCEIEEHLKDCDECREAMELLENKAFVGGPDAAPYKLNKIQASFLKKVISRVFSIVFIILAAWYALFYLILPLAFSKSILMKEEQSRYAVNDLIQFTVPGARIINIPVSNKMGIFNLYQYAEFEKRLTGGFTKSARIDLAVPAYLGKSDLKLNWSLDSQQGGDITFKYPAAGAQSSQDASWGKLEKVQTGTKAFAAVYFTNPLTTKDVEGILEKISSDDYNTWLAVDSGQKNINKVYGGGIYVVEWGFPMCLQLTPATADRVTKDSSGHISGMESSHRGHDVGEVSEKFKKEMKDFEQYSKYLGSDEFTKEVSEVNRYLTSNELRIKGAILSAPTSYLMKLKGNPRIARIDILKVDFDY